MHQLPWLSENCNQSPASGYRAENQHTKEHWDDALNWLRHAGKASRVSFVDLIILGASTCHEDCVALVAMLHLQACGYQPRSRTSASAAVITALEDPKISCDRCSQCARRRRVRCQVVVLFQN